MSWGEHYRAEARKHEVQASVLRFNYPNHPYAVKQAKFHEDAAEVYMVLMREFFEWLSTQDTGEFDAPSG